MKKLYFFLGCLLLFSNLNAQIWHTTNITANDTWSGIHIIAADIVVTNGVVLVMEEGATISFNQNCQLDVQGCLQANGTSGNPITFTANTTTPVPGFWDCISFSTADENCYLTNCLIEYAGNIGGNVTVHNSSDNVAISNCDIRYSESDGLFINDLNTSLSVVYIDDCLIHDNALYGINSSIGYSGAVISNCNIYDNGSYPIRTFANYADNITGNMQFSGNGHDAIYIDGDNINTSTWLKHPVPYAIYGDITVLNGNTLTISPGCTLKFGSAMDMQINGQLIASGTSSERITFTSDQSTPTPGHWGHLHFNTADAGCLLDYCDVTFGGAVGANSGNITIHNSAGNVTVSNSTIAYSSNCGVFLNDQNTSASVLYISNSVVNNNATYGINCSIGYSGLVISDCTVSNNGGYPIRTFANYADNITGNMQIVGNGYDEIYVDGDNIYTGTWLKQLVSYNIFGDVTVIHGNTLTINPGCMIKFGSGIDMQVAGRLIASGTTSERITFTSAQTIPTPGYWGHLYFNAADAGCVMDYCDVTFGGAVGATSGNITIHNSAGNVTVSNSSIAYSSNCGVFLNDLNTSASVLYLSNSVVNNNATYGINCSIGYSGLVISDCAVLNNGGYPIRTFANYVDNITGNMQISGNGFDEIYVDGDNIYNGTWLKQPVPYNIYGDVTVIHGNTLTINPGCTLKFGSGIDMQIAGRLIASGTTSDRITFTSAQAIPTPGYWSHIYFNAADAGCILDYCDVTYGGAAGAYSGNITIHNSGANVTVSNSNVAFSSTNGVFLNDQNTSPSTLYTSNSSYHHNSGYGIRCDVGYSGLVASDCAYHDNGDYALRVYGNYVDNITGVTTISGNVSDAIYVDGDNIYSGSWLNHGVPYIIGGDQIIINGNTLTFNPGCVLQLTANADIAVQGIIFAQGTPDEHIIFTSASLTPAPGDWGSIYFNSADPGCLLDYCDLSYGGYTNAILHIRNSSSNVQLNHCTIGQSLTSGILINDQNTYPSSVSISNCSVVNNTNYGIQSYYAGTTYLSQSVISGNSTGFYSNLGALNAKSNNSIHSNSDYGIYLAGNTQVYFGSNIDQWNEIYNNSTYNFYNGTANINAPFVYWGSTNLAAIQASIYDDLDNSSLGLVSFEPWINQAHDSLFPASYFMVNIKAMLEGPFNGTELNNTLNASLPLNQPFAPSLPYFGNPSPAWYYTGTESVTSIPGSSIVDWILLDLRDAVSASVANSSASIAKKALFITQSGDIISTNGYSLPMYNHNVVNNLYAVVWHRNHLGIMSAFPLVRTGSTYNYDFTTDASQAYGGATGHKQIAAGIWGMISGDGNGDGVVSNADKTNVWSVQAGTSGYKAADFNMNGQVDNMDKTTYWRPNSGAGSQIP